MDYATRADAHLRWAERYDRQSNTSKAAAHFGRALEYDRRAKREKKQKFGNDWDTSDGGLGIKANMNTLANVARATVVAAPVVTALVTAAGATAVNSVYDAYRSLFSRTEPVPEPASLARSLVAQAKGMQLKGATLELPSAAQKHVARTLTLGSGSGGVGTSALVTTTRTTQPTSRHITTTQKPETSQIKPTTLPEPAPDVKQIPETHIEVHLRYIRKLKEEIDSMDTEKKQLLLKYTEKCIEAHTEIQKANEDKSWTLNPLAWFNGKNEKSSRNKAKAFEQAINAILARDPMKVPPDEQHDVDDTHSNAYTMALEKKGIIKLRSDVVCNSQPYKNWPAASCMRQALWDIYAIVEDAVFSLNWNEHQKAKKNP